MPTCTVSGQWDQVKGTSFKSKQEFQAAFLLIACECVNAANGGSIMAACTTTDGIWSQVKNGGNANLSDQEFYGKAIDLMCQLAGAITSGGGAASGLTFTQAAGDPPLDGSVTTQGYKNTTSGVKFINVAWPVTAAPQWEQI